MRDWGWNALTPALSRWAREGVVWTRGLIEGGAAIPGGVEEGINKQWVTKARIRNVSGRRESRRTISAAG